MLYWTREVCRNSSNLDFYGLINENLEVICALRQRLFILS